MPKLVTECEEVVIQHEGDGDNCKGIIKLGDEDRRALTFAHP